MSPDANHPKDATVQVDRAVDCLLIGAMKCGTTSLSADLAQHPGVYVPAVKEPHFLCMRREPQARVRELYATLFDRARPGQLRVDGSTGYSKRPTVEGVAERALQLGGRDLRILYIVRDPVKRALSHHYHLHREGRAPADFGEALRKYPELIDYGRYAWQLEPWIEAFGLSRILVVRFEDYVGGRAQVLDRVFGFLGVGALPQYGSAPAENVGEENTIARPAVRRLLGNVRHRPLYKLYVRPYLPAGLRRAYSSVARTAAPSRPGAPTADLLAELRAAFAEDIRRLSGFVGSQDPLWLIEDASSS
jgi:hypothetical protein